MRWKLRDSRNRNVANVTFQYPDITTLQYRDIHAFDEENAALLSIGEGNQSQIHLFSNGTWNVAFVMLDHPKGFLDSIEFWNNDQYGLAYGDSFDGKPYILKTENRGQSWTRIDPSTLPDATGEGGFASSGSCIATYGNGSAWIGTGSNGYARIFKTQDYGNSWQVYDTPIVKGESAGITSVHFRNNDLGLITGGDLTITDKYTDNVALSTDGGQNWALTKGTMFKKC